VQDHFVYNPNSLPVDTPRNTEFLFEYLNHHSADERCSDTYMKFVASVRLSDPGKNTLHKDDIFANWANDAGVDLDPERLGYRATEFRWDGVYRSAFKYDKPQPKVIDEAAWAYANEAMTQHFYPHLRHCEPWSWERVINETDRSKSCGWPFNIVYKSKGELIDEDWYVDYLRHYEEALFDHYPLETLWTAKKKDELKPYAKALTKPRIFVIAPVHQYHLNLRWCGDFNQKFYDTAMRHSSFVGKSKFRFEWHQMIAQHLDRNPCGSFENDEAEYDSSLFVRALFAVNQLRTLCYKIEHRYRASIAHYKLTRSNLKCKMLMPDGNILDKETGNSSGSGNTIVDNTIVLYMFFAYAFFLSVWDHPAVFELRPSLFDKLVVLTINGDDNLYTVAKKVIEFFNNITLRQHLAPLGIVCESPTDVARPAHDCSFLSHHSIQYFGLWLPMPQTEKVLASLAFKAKTREPIESFIRASSLLLDSWPNAETRRILRLYCDYLVARFGRNIETWRNAMSGYKTDAELLALYTGFESGVARKITPLLKEDDWQSGQSGEQDCAIQSKAFAASSPEESCGGRKTKTSAEAFKRRQAAKSRPSRMGATPYAGFNVGAIGGALSLSDHRRVMLSHSGAKFGPKANPRVDIGMQHGPRYIGEFSDARGRVHKYAVCREVLASVGFNSTQTGHTQSDIIIPEGAQWFTAGNADAGQYIFMCNLNITNHRLLVPESKLYTQSVLLKQRLTFLPAEGFSASGRQLAWIRYSRELPFDSTMLAGWGATVPLVNFTDESYEENTLSRQVMDKLYREYTPLDPDDAVYVPVPNASMGIALCSWGTADRPCPTTSSSTGFGWDAGANVIPTMFQKGTDAQSRGYTAVWVFDRMKSGDMMENIGDIFVETLVEFSGVPPRDSTGEPVGTTISFEQQLSNLRAHDPDRLRRIIESITPQLDVSALNSESITRSSLAPSRSRAGPAVDALIPSKPVRPLVAARGAERKW